MTQVGVNKVESDSALEGQKPYHQSHAAKNRVFWSRLAKYRVHMTILHLLECYMGWFLL
jgi:hypothetical protein